MGRNVCPPTSRDAGIGTWPIIDRGAERPLLRKYCGYFRSGLDRPKLGPSRKRRPPVGIKIGRYKESVRSVIPRRRNFLLIRRWDLRGGAHSGNILPRDSRIPFYRVKIMDGGRVSLARIPTRRQYENAEFPK